MKKKSTLESKLARYTAVAGAIVASGSMVNAQVEYTDVSPDLVVNNPDEGADLGAPIDLNNDGVVDFAPFVANRMSNNVGAVVASPYGSMGNEIAGTVPSAYNYPTQFASGDAIDSSVPWLAADAAGTMCYVSEGASPYAENWNGGPVDGYLGLRFQVAGNTHYGWARLDVAADGLSFTLKSYAYNLTADAGVTAGSWDQESSVSSVNEITLEGVNIYTNGTNIVVNLDEELTNGTVEIRNMAGQIVANSNLNNSTTEIGVDGVNAGVYVVTAKFDEGVITKRLFIK